jgi:hypothetical protein
VIPLGGDLSSVPSCAGAIADNATMTLNNAHTERSSGDVNREVGKGNLIIPILTKGGTEELTAAPTPRAAVLRLLEGVEDCSSAYFIGCLMCPKVSRIYFSLPLGEFSTRPMPHSTSPGNNW